MGRESPNWSSLITKQSFQYRDLVISDWIVGQRGAMEIPKQLRLLLRLCIALCKLTANPYFWKHLSIQLTEYGEIESLPIFIPIFYRRSLWYSKIICILPKENWKHQASHNPLISNRVLPANMLVQWWHKPISDFTQGPLHKMKSITATTIKPRTRDQIGHRS